MLNMGDNSGPSPRCLVTDLKLSNYINHDDPPRKKKPFSIILNQTYVHTLDLLIPTTSATIFQQNLSSNDQGILTYAKVHMKLLDLISGDFFAQYIKTPGTSNILMLSEGRVGIDNVYSLHEGKLSLEIDKSTFEHIGLEGKAIPSLGRKHVKQRYLVEIDLRSPSMLQGKKGFERVKWTFQNVLNEAKTWLVADLKNPDGVEKGPLVEFAPAIKRTEPMIEKINEALVPTWPEGVKDEDYADAAELLEWIGLATMLSPRIEKSDDIDPYLCRYQVPTAYGEVRTQNLVRLRWRGLIYPAFAQRIFLAALKAAGMDWIAMSAVAFDGEAYTILVHNDHSIAWEYKD